MIRHPSKRALYGWLLDESHETDKNLKIDLHVATCDRCATTLEGLDPQDTDDGSIGKTLALLLAPPEGLATRLETGVVERLDSRQVAGYVADLFGAAVETSKLLLTEERPNREHSTSEEQ